jgi:hypothetical protein
MDVVKNIMQEYSIKRGHGKDLGNTMVQGLRDQFGVEPEESSGHYTISYGALARLEVWLGEGGKTIVVDTQSNTDVADDVIIDTNRRFRDYLLAVTGYTAKERAKKAQKSVK